MATAKKTNRKTATATRRAGRPTNAERTQRIQSQQSQLIDTAMAAASAAAKAALGIVDGGVTSINQNANGASSGTPAKTAKQRQAPGRRTDPNSKMSLTRDFYDANLKAATPLSRSELVKAAAKKFGYSQQTGNTYISKIDNEAGRKLSRRRVAPGARTKSAAAA